MATRPTAWKPGQSGNPNGRPPKNRALTEILEAAGKHTIEDVDGVRRASRKVLARLLWEISTTGRAKMPDGSTLQLDPGDWFGVVKFIYQHIDGPPRQDVDITSGGDKITINLSWEGEDENNDQLP